MGTRTTKTAAARGDVTFTVDGVDCAAWHYPATTDVLGGPAGRPCVVLAHGFGGTRDSGLEGFADAFARAGIDALLFDYRTFGASAGQPRQVFDIDAQLADYTGAVACARGLGGIDGDRVAVWGVSLSGGHALKMAATDGRLAAAVALTPVTDGRAAARAALRRTGARPLLASLPAALAASVRRSGALYTPVAGAPGTNAGVSAPGASEAYAAIAGPTWENRYTATNPLQLGGYRPGRQASQVTCPVLVQIGDHDQSAPPLTAAQDARKLTSAEVRHYPCDHFDVYPGMEWHDHVVAHQVRFLTRHLAIGVDA